MKSRSQSPRPARHVAPVAPVAQAVRSSWTYATVIVEVERACSEPPADLQSVPHESERGGVFQKLCRGCVRESAVTPLRERRRIAASFQAEPPTMRPSQNGALRDGRAGSRSEEHTSELQPLMRISYAVFCLKKKT